MILLGRTTTLKDNFFFDQYMPSLNKGILSSVTTQIPQITVNNIQQVRRRGLAGIYKYNLHPLTISYSFLTNRQEAETKFANLIQYMILKSGGIANITNIPQDEITYIGNASISVDGLNLVRYDVSMTLMNVSDIYLAQNDPLTFIGLNFDDLESEIEVSEEDNDDLVTGYSYSIFMRVDLNNALNGYRSIKFAHAVMSQSIRYIDNEYNPQFLFDQFIIPESIVTQVSTSLDTDNVRTYTASRQASLNIDTTTQEVTIGL